MDKFLIFIIIVIFLLSSYLIYRNYQSYKILESFSTQGSLSTYYQDTVDSDLYQTNINSFNYNIQNPIGINNTWNGTWTGAGVYAQFLQINDKVIIVLTSLSIDNNNASNSAVTNSMVLLTNIGNNVFIAVGQLNFNKTMFTITNYNNIFNTSYTNPVIGLVAQTPSNSPNVNNLLSGTISGNNITIYPYSNTNSNSLTLTLSQPFQYNYSGTSSNLPALNMFDSVSSPYTQQTPSINPGSNIGGLSSNITSLFCPNGKVLCTAPGYGLGNSIFAGLTGNACGTLGANGICTGTPTCLLGPASNNVNTCSIQSQQSLSALTKNIGFYAPSTLMKTDKICNYLSYCSGTYNQVILCYISNASTIQTLNCQFFDSFNNGLTVQTDMTSQALNLSNYQTILSSKTSTPSSLVQMNTISFSNLLATNNNASNTQTILTNCLTQFQNNYISSLNTSGSTGSTGSTGATGSSGPVISNNYPLLWNINFGKLPSEKNLNSCGFTLSTSNIYPNDVQKFVQYNNSTQQINMSLYSGGNSQQFFFENVNPLVTNGNLSSSSTPINYTVMTVNIRTNNGFYLIPGQDYGAFNGINNNNAEMIGLQPTAQTYGRWLIIGSNLNSTNQLSYFLNNINF